MSFSYDLSTGVGKVRMYLSDTVQNVGVRPDGSNLSDEEINILLAQNAQNVMLTVASACNLLSIAWTRAADVSVGPRREALSQVAKQYLAESKSLNEQFGGLSEVTTALPKRADGYALVNPNTPAVGANISDYFRARQVVRRGWF